MEYVIIGFGYKEIYTAETAREAAEHAAEVARREKLSSYIVYDRAGNEVACCERLRRMSEAEALTYF